MVSYYYFSFFLFILIIFGNKINEEYTISAKKGTITVDVGGDRRYLEKRVDAYGKLRGCQVGQLIFFSFF